MVVSKAKGPQLHAEFLVDSFFNCINISPPPPPQPPQGAVPLEAVPHLREPSSKSSLNKDLKVDQKIPLTSATDLLSQPKWGWLYSLQAHLFEYTLELF